MWQAEEEDPDKGPDFARMYSGKTFCGYRIVEEKWWPKNSTLWLVQKNGKMSMMKWIRPEVGRELIKAEVDANKELESLHCIHLAVGKGFNALAGSKAFFMPYYKNGDLDAYIKTSGQMSPTEIAQCTYHMVGALAKMHGIFRVHRDIKPENIFVSSSKEAILGDFGLCVKLGPGELIRRFFGTQEWASPEVLAGRPYDYAVDLWGLGEVLYFMATCRHPFAAEENLAYKRKVQHGEWEREGISGEGYEQLADLIGNLLSADPGKRKTAAKVLQHPFYEGVRGVVTTKAQLASIDKALWDAEASSAWHESG
jgi:serine/threonine protein kinase